MHTEEIVFRRFIDFISQPVDCTAGMLRHAQDDRLYLAIVDLLKNALLV